MPYKDIEKQRAYQRQRIAEARASWFKGKSCARCGSKKNLQLDHVDPSTKISHRIWSWTPTKRYTELTKCQILCQDCHQKKTAEENSRPITHATEGGYHRGCRCRDCMNVHNLRKLHYRRARRKAGFSYT